MTERIALFIIGAGYTALCFAAGAGLGALLNRRPR